MPITGRLTMMLKPEHVAAGWRLDEDEDFLYLFQPGVAKPKIFSSKGATIESIEAEIAKA